MPSQRDVLNTSLFHCLWFCEKSALEHVGKDHIISHELHTNVIKLLQYKLTDKTNVLANPILGNLELNILADADLIIDDELIDFKTNRKESRGKLISEFIQLFLYATLYYKKTNKYLKYLTLYNPFLFNRIYYPNY